MHIEPGFVAPAKVMFANMTAVSLLAYYAKSFLSRPFDLFKAVIAAVFFSVFMQSFHMNVGPSELHFVGAMAIYLTLGFVPTMFGFAAGLLLQGVIFDPHDLPHLAVNSLSLIVPLVSVHYTIGKGLFDRAVNKRVSWAAILKLDGMYYAGVTLMVGFWLLIGEVEAPFTAWLKFAISYLAVVAIEPVVTLSTVKLLKRYEHAAIVRKLFVVDKLEMKA